MAIAVRLAFAGLASHSLQGGGGSAGGGSIMAAALYRFRRTPAPLHIPGAPTPTGPNSVALSSRDRNIPPASNTGGKSPRRAGLDSAPLPAYSSSAGLERGGFRSAANAGAGAVVLSPTAAVRGAGARGANQPAGAGGHPQQHNQLHGNNGAGGRGTSAAQVGGSAMRRQSVGGGTASSGFARRKVAGGGTGRLGSSPGNQQRAGPSPGSNGAKPLLSTPITLGGARLKLDQQDPGEALDVGGWTPSNSGLNSPIEDMIIRSPH
jgi:hypothetical protein